ncbi:catechol 2,3-dioxygenase-like lactoylglutathione lyase family enzyme [Peribacillus cavernae]|nr:catechol 2,3-dioxygenase-like lactoylglutathione lyase family enzyme [Peribacillus cavernae]
MIKNLATVALYVDNQEQTKNFWTKKVGFEIKAEHEMVPTLTG